MPVVPIQQPLYSGNFFSTSLSHVCLGYKGLESTDAIASEQATSVELFYTQYVAKLYMSAGHGFHYSWRLRIWTDKFHSIPTFCIMNTYMGGCSK
jgi:hypothetical protein